MKIKPYPEYKPSGIEWLGDVPAHWNIDRLKLSVQYVRNGVWGNDPGEDNAVICIRVADFDRNKLRVIDEPPTCRSYAESELRGRVLEPDDLLIEKSGGGDNQLVGCVVLFGHSFKAVCSNFIARIPISENNDPRFWVYVHSVLYASKMTFPSIKQTTGIQNLDSYAYLNELSPYPPFPEQYTIAAFLDRETGRIDDLVEKKKQLIELLKEKRSALISKAVTKGLNPSVKLKSSGVEWLGDIPGHWDVRRLGYTTYVKGRIGWQGLTSDEFVDEGPYCVTGTDFARGRIEWDRCYHVSVERYLEDPYIQLRENDLLITKDGTIGKTAVVTELPSEATLNSGIFLTRPKSNLYLTNYMYWLLNSKVFSGFIEFNKIGSTISHLYQNVFVRFLFPFPPVTEQKAIATFLDSETGKINSLIALVETAIEKLKEYRTALISAAVTGKIDVRKYVS